MKRIGRRTLTLLFASVLLPLALPWLVASMLMRPVQSVVGEAPAKLNAKSVTFRSASGATISGWWCAVEHSRGTVILLPGVRANRRSMIDRGLLFHAQRFDVLLIDLQSTGESSGKQITLGYLESRDVSAAIAFVRKERGETPIALVGTSLGGAAVLLADPPVEVQAIVLESVYPTIERAVTNRIDLRFPHCGGVLAPLLLWQVPARLGVTASALRPVEHIGRISAPLLLIAGTADRHTTVSDTLLLYANAHSPKELWLVPGAAHVDLQHYAPIEYERRVVPFVERSFSAH